MDLLALIEQLGPRMRYASRIRIEPGPGRCRVTVSMAEDKMGTFSPKDASLVLTSTSPGSTALWAGRSSTSSKLKARGGRSPMSQVSVPGPTVMWKVTPLCGHAENSQFCPGR